MNDYKIKFNGSPKPTIGVELELFTLDKETLGLTNGGPLILNHFRDNLSAHSRTFHHIQHP